MLHGNIFAHPALGYHNRVARLRDCGWRVRSQCLRPDLLRLDVGHLGQHLRDSISELSQETARDLARGLCNDKKSPVFGGVRASGAPRAMAKIVSDRCMPAIGSSTL
jgi:hypothetical protein